MKKYSKIFQIITKRNFNKFSFCHFCNKLNIEKEKLKKTLDKELSYEHMSYNNNNTNTNNNFLQENKFDIEDIANSNKFILRKKEGKFNIEISCNSRSPLPNMENSKHNFFLFNIFIP